MATGKIPMGLWLRWSSSTNLIYVGHGVTDERCTSDLYHTAPCDRSVPEKSRYQVHNAEPFLLLLPDCLHIYMLGNSDLREVQWRDCVDQVQINALVTSEQVISHCGARHICPRPILLHRFLSSLSHTHIWQEGWGLSVSVCFLSVRGMWQGQRHCPR